MKPFWNVKFQGGILPLVLGISIITATLCSILIFYSYYSKLHILKMEMSFTLQQNSDSGIEYLLSSGGYNNSPVRMDLFGEKRDSIIIRKTRWGLYDILWSKALRGTQSYSQVILAGDEIDSLHQSTLNLTDSKSPLYLSGDAKLTGTVYLPNSGVRPGNVGGEGYKGSKLISGNKRQSKSSLPELREGISSSLSNYLEISQTNETNTWDYFDQLPDSITHSFMSERPLVFYFSDKIELKSYAKGMIIFFSEEKIIVDEEARLKHVLLISPKIEVRKNFKGAIQIIASDIIEIGDSTHLLYPSALLMKPTGKEGKIELKESSFVQGEVLMDRIEDNLKEGIFILKPKSVLEGFAHIDGAVQVQGKVLGHLSCKKFSLNIGIESFGNAIKDAELNYSSKAPWSTVSGLWTGRHSKIVTKLY